MNKTERWFAERQSSWDFPLPKKLKPYTYFKRIQVSRLLQVELAMKDSGSARIRLYDNTGEILNAVYMSGYTRAEMAETLRELRKTIADDIIGSR